MVLSPDIVTIIVQIGLHCQFKKRKQQDENKRPAGKVISYSTVTDFARLRGLSTSQPRVIAA